MCACVCAALGCLHRGEGGRLLEFAALDLGTRVLSAGDGRGTAVELIELGDVSLRSLENLNLSDVDVLERVDGLASLLDLSANDLWNELGDELLKVTGRALSLDNVEHLLSDLALLRRLCVGSLGYLVGTPAGETNDKDSE